MTLQSVGLKIDRSRAIACDPLQLAVEVHLGLPFFLLEIVLSAVSSSGTGSGSSSSSGSAVNSRGGYVKMVSAALMCIAYSLSHSHSHSHSLSLSLSLSLFLSHTNNPSSSHSSLLPLQHWPHP